MRAQLLDDLQKGDMPPPALPVLAGLYALTTAAHCLEPLARGTAQPQVADRLGELCTKVTAALRAAFAPLPEGDDQIPPAFRRAFASEDGEG